jgi:hypothetical protein
MTHATGSFEVKLTPQDDKSEDLSIGRITIDKLYHGDLEAASKGQMLYSSTEVKDSGSYVAIEKVNGTLNGQKGTFIMQHNGTMIKGAPAMSVIIVTDSGTGELKGITGKMTIKIDDGKHSYDIEYTLGNSE